MNGSNGIQPTVELATTNGNGFYPYPFMYGNGYGNNGGIFGSDGIWAIVLLALLFNNGGFGGFGGWGGNNVATTDFVSSEFTQVFCFSLNQYERNIGPTEFRMLSLKLQR